MSSARRETTVPTRMAPLGGVWAVVFVAVSVVSLAVVPLVLGERAARAQREVEEVLEPVRFLGTRLALVQARQMSLFQAFLLTGDTTFRAPYLQALEEERRVTAGLEELAAGLDRGVWQRLNRLTNIATGWHLGHQLAFSSDEMRRRMVLQFEVEQRRYEQVQEATLAMEQVIRSEVEEGRARAASIRARQTQVALAFLVLGLGATLAVALVGYRLRLLTAEADARRRDAVRARREMDALLEATGDGVLGMDLDGRILSLNRAGSELLGWTEGQLTGRDVHDVLHHSTPDGAPRERSASALLGALREGGAATVTDDVLWRSDGVPLPVQWSLRPLVDGLVVRGAVLTFADLTEIRAQAEALRRAVRVRDEVVAVVSHDLKNPLGVVAGAADLLLDLPLDEAERRKQADIIRRSAERMGRLVGDLLDVARIEAGGLVVHPVPQSPEEILAEAEAFFRHQAEERGVRLEVTTDVALPTVDADPDRVQQALSNLLANALRFAPSGSTVTLGAWRQGDRWVALTVQDQGPGIPEALQSHIFDRFWQASRHDRTGTGLGLAIVQGIARAHGGTVEVSSRPGEGALFSLLLPARPKESR